MLPDVPNKERNMSNKITIQTIIILSFQPIVKSSEGLKVHFIRQRMTEPGPLSPGAEENQVFKRLIMSLTKLTKRGICNMPFKPAEVCCQSPRQSFPQKNLNFGSGSYLPHKIPEDF